MRTEVIKADSIEAAVERILAELREDDAARSISGRNNNVIYFDGWDGLGASTVLRAVSQRLAMASEAPAGLKFDQIIHVDCSKWENRRVLQRAIAEQLELPAPLMDMFDRQDEDDEFNGVSLESRLEIPQVLRGMHRRIKDLNHRFLVIFHNGSNEEIDLASFGFPLSQYLDNKVLWTFQGRFRLYPRNKVVGAIKSTAGASKTDVFLSASHRLGGTEPHELRTVLVHQEASEVTAQSEITINTSNGPAQVGKHFLLHMLKLCCMGLGQNLLMDYDLATHACNYWICDGIIQRQGDGDDISTDGGGDEGLWRAAAALQREMRLDVHYYQYEHKYFPSQLAPYGMWTMPNSTASYEFLAIPAGAIPNSDMFQDFNKLRVLKLSRRTFSFSSPPFIYCHNLKFLWLDHCQDQDNHSSIDDGFPREEQEDKITDDGAGTKDDFQRCFQRLWVLDVRYTPCDRILSQEMLDFMTQLRELNVTGAQDLDMGRLHGRLHNIRKLRVTKSTVRCSGHSELDLFQGMDKMELLDFSGNRIMQGGVTKFSNISTSNSYLETLVIIAGCVGIKKLSFRGCAKLKNLLLSGSFEDLYTLDLSGTAVKTLDLSAMTARRLDELILDNCDKLCAIVWPPEDKRQRYLEKVQCDTTWSAASLIPMEGKSTTSSSGSLSEVHGGRAPSEFKWCIRVRDARLLRSLVPFEQYFNDWVRVHMEIYSSPVAFSSSSNNKAASSNSSIKQQHALVNVDEPTVYADVGFTHPLVQPSEGDAPMLTQIQMWPCPRMPSYSFLAWYTHIQGHHLSSESLPGGEQTMTSIVVPDMICRKAYILHVHDNLAITSIPGLAPTVGSTWYWLEWCRVERCPNLERVFTTPQLQARDDGTVFGWLETFWASKLPKVRYIWDWTPTSVFQFRDDSFWKMRLLHMDLCPRLIHVLPLALPKMVHGITLGQLETLEIMWCADLREVFPLFTKDAKSVQQQQQSATTTVHFKFLKHIHLHELPKLQGICGQWRMSAPKLETVKIRGCWNLKRLPAVGNNTSKKVECDCEKDWWDTLEWDGFYANHHPSLYKATHSRYYKKTLLKGSVLR